jgi:hypothetical protein
MIVSRIVLHKRVVVCKKNKKKYDFRIKRLQRFCRRAIFIVSKHGGAEMTVKSLEINGCVVTITAETLNTGISSSFTIVKNGKEIAKESTYWIKQGKFVGEQSRQAVLALIDECEADEAKTESSIAHMAENAKRDADMDAYYESNAAIKKAMSY